ncbi:MAG: FG-GAP repeat protein [Candidatus Latescibacterota bacterium]|nr:MAG: FG-GAP repeat protein [Candidatus Latescibacterota bacterium]
MFFSLLKPDQEIVEKLTREVRCGERKILPIVVAILCVFVVATSSFAQVLSHEEISQTEGFLNKLLDADQFGSSVTTLGDVDGDGTDDVAVGEWMGDFEGQNRGTVWILFLNTDGTVAKRQNIAAGRGGFPHTTTVDDNDRFGISVAGIGDLDLDGVPDLAVGAALDDDGGAGPSANRGAVWILFLNDDGTVKAYQKISDTEGNFTGVLDDEDRFGVSVAFLGDLDLDTNPEIAVGAELDDDGASNAGAVWILSLDTGGTVISHQKISATEGGFGGVVAADEHFGSSVARVGDLDGDLVTELAVGERDDDDGGAGSGAIWILFLNTDGTVLSEQKISATAGGLVGVLDPGDGFGSAVTGLQDFNIDGVEDIAVGAPGDDDGGDARGAIYVIFLNDDGTVNSYQKISDTLGGFTGVLDNVDEFGAAVTMVNDLNGGGVTDLLVGAPMDDDGLPENGAAWVLLMDPSGNVGSHQKISQTVGGFTTILEDGDWFGESGAAIGDVNDDGVNDLAVGAPSDDDGDSNQGAVYILFMRTNGTVEWHQKISEQAGNFTGVLDALDQFGSSVVGLGDLDGDGVEDIAVGAPLDDDGGTPPNANRGAVWILFLNDDGTVKSHHKIADNVGGFETTLIDGDFFGYSLAYLGDLGTDGLYELAVGAINDDDGGTSRGAVWVLSMYDDGLVDSAQKISDDAGNFTGTLADGDYFGTSLAAIGDLNGDGRPDLVARYQNGELIERHEDLDYDGTADVVSYYTNGKLVRRELSSEQVLEQWTDEHGP